MQQKYEAMFLIRPDLPQASREALLNQINDAITKNQGKIASSSVWQEKKPLAYEIKKFKEATYYLVNFDIDSESIINIKNTYKLIEDILRLMIIKLE